MEQWTIMRGPGTCWFPADSICTEAFKQGAAKSLTEFAKHEPGEEGISRQQGMTHATEYHGAERRAAVTDRYCPSRDGF